MIQRPTGIIRTLPSLYFGLGEEPPGRVWYDRNIKALEHGEDVSFGIALPCKPKLDVLYIYLLIEGQIDVRLNIVGYEDGSALQCWDPAFPQPKYWAICTGPVSRPPEPMPRRGFQGIRYTEDLW